MGKGILPMPLMLIISIPLYICAAASTPIAAALGLKGISPGTALVLLLAGPTTNIASLASVTGILGKRATVAYLSSIGFCSLVMGYLTDLIYHSLNLDITHWIDYATSEKHGFFYTLPPIVLITLILHSILKKLLMKPDGRGLTYPPLLIHNRIKSE